MPTNTGWQRLRVIVEVSVKEGHHFTEKDLKWGVQRAIEDRCPFNDFNKHRSPENRVPHGNPRVMQGQSFLPRYLLDKAKS